MHQIRIGKGRLFRWFKVVLPVETPASIAIFLVFLLLRFDLPEEIGLIFPSPRARPGLEIQLGWFLCETEGIFSGANLMLLQVHEQIFLFSLLPRTKRTTRRCINEQKFLIVVHLWKSENLWDDKILLYGIPFKSDLLPQFTPDNIAENRLSFSFPSKGPDNSIENDIKMMIGYDRWWM